MLAAPARASPTEVGTACVADRISDGILTKAVPASTLREVTGTGGSTILHF